jgi:hypothetical protein
MRYDFDKTPATYVHQDIPTTAVPVNVKERPHSLTLLASGLETTNATYTARPPPNCISIPLIPDMQPWE